MTITDEVLAATIPAVVTGVLGYLSALWQFRRKPAEETDAIASAFTRLVDQLQEENGRHLASISVLRKDAHDMRNQLMKLRAFAETLFKHIAVLERQIVGLGATPAARPVLPDTI